MRGEVNKFSVFSAKTSSDGTKCFVKGGSCTDNMNNTVSNPTHWVYVGDPNEPIKIHVKSCEMHI